MEISKLSGFDSKNSMSEANLCDAIANDVDKKLSVLSTINSHKDGLFGIDSRMKDVELLIEPEANGERMVGIWGMGGIGKTTLAGKVFNRIKNKFGGHSFVLNVREKLSKNLEIKDLRDQIIREVLGDKHRKIDSPCEIDDSIQRKLKDVKVFIVLDDVDNCQQLKFLLEDSGLCYPGVFGSGSRIIVTSRDKQVLENVNMQKRIYHAEKLNDDEALQLFSWHAFHQCYPQEEYKELSEKVVHYCDGLPLALVVLGSELKGKRIRELAEFSSIPHMDILKILRINFDGLGRNEKSIFLDIACFFKGDSVEDVERKLECFGFHARNGIDRLCDKSLITNCGGIIEMHDLVQQMGQEIVVEQSGQKQESQSRLWTYKDISGVLTNDGGTENVEAISLNGHEIDGYREISSKAFLHMRKLRFLQVIYCDFFWNRVRLPEDLEFLPNSLRYLKWEHYPSSSLLSNFNLENLVELHMPYSRLKQFIWNKPLRNLKRICFNRSKYLIKISDLAKAPNLEVIELNYCIRLVEIGLSMENLRSLKSLDISDCEYLNKLPEHLRNLESLETLHASGSGLIELPSSICSLRSLKFLDISDCESLIELPEHLENLKSLENLDASRSGIKKLPSSICNLSSLTVLNISYCESLNKLPEHLGKLKSLENLNASRSCLKKLPSSICNLKSLKVLNISYCESLNKLPEHLGHLKSLENLDASRSGLEELPSSICNLRSLTVLNISYCESLNKLPEHLENLQSLENLDASGSGLKELPSSICNLRSLTNLDITYCESLNKLPEHLGNLKTLENLDAYGSGLMELPSSICNLRSLTSFDISYCERLNKLPEHFGNLESLEKLDASKSGLKELPSSIQHLRKLEFLDLRECKKLESLPYLPSNLKELYAANCTSLKSVSATFKFPRIIVDLSNCQKLNEGASSVTEQILWQIQLLSADKWPHLCIVGSEVPQWMKYRNDSGYSVSLELDAHGSSVHVIFCVVVAANPCREFSLSSLRLHASLIDEWGRSGKVYWFDFSGYEYGAHEMKFDFEHVFLWSCRVEHNVREASFSTDYGDRDGNFKIIKSGIHSIIENQI